MKKKPVKILIWFGLWIVAFVVVAAIEEFVLKLNMRENYTIGVAIITYPIISFLGWIIRDIIRYSKNKEINLSRIYRIILVCTLGDMLKDGDYIIGSRKFIKEGISNVSNKKKLIFNVLSYIAAIVALILIVIDGDVIKLPVNAFVVTVIIYGIITILFCLFVLPKKKTEKEVEAADIDDRAHKIGKIMATILALIIIVPIIVIMAIFIPNMK